MTLPGLLRRRLSARERAALEWHQARGRQHLAPHRGNTYALEDLDRLGDKADKLKDDPALALSVLVTALEASSGEAFDWLAHELASKLVRRKLPYTLEDAELLVRLVEVHKGASWFKRSCARAAAAALETRVVEGDEVGELADRLLSEAVKRHESEAAEWTKLARRVRALTPPRAGASLDLSVVRADDPWSERVRPVLAQEFSRCGPLLEHLATATQSKPSRPWLSGVEPLLGGDGAAMVETLLEAAVEVRSRELGREVYDGVEYVSYLWLSDPSATIIRGALWAASLIEGAERIALTCERLVTRSRQEEQIKIGNAVFYCLGERADDAAVAVLGRAVTQLKDRRFLKPALAALEVAAGRRGVSSEQLREQLVPTFGLDANGRLERELGPARALVELATPAQVKTRFVLDGRETAGAPPELKDRLPDVLAEFKRELAELRKELAVQRQRVEALLASARVWPFEDWQAHYLEHPVVQLFARRLIWRFDRRAAIPLSRNEFLTLDGPIQPPTGGEVSLWHPLDEAPEQIAAWRELLRDRELQQPFKQAYREIYLVAPAEQETRLYSNRFAAHIVRYPQVYALAKQRGWGVRALGWFDNDGGEQWRDFTEHGIRVSFWMELADTEIGAGAIADLAATDQVRFSGIGEREPLAVEDVPPLVFSEAMRDVDLFVGVASIAADPTWIDGGIDRFNAYWQEHAFSELGESAKIRREVLAELLPGLKIHDRLELDDRYLRVRGQLHSYRIHLGSANVLIEPHDRYLCIVPDRRPSTGRLFLPFEDDRLSVIISKARLLAADDRIEDPTITQQLR